MTKLNDTARMIRNGLVFIMIVVPSCLFRTAPAAAVEALMSSVGGAEIAAVTVEPQTHDGVNLYAIRYRASRGDCAITWIAYNNEPGVVKYQPDCPAPLAEQLPLLRDICADYLNQDPGALAFRTLFWGRLAPDSAAASREMSFRLAAAAYASPGWDRVRGRPRQGDINRFARDLAKQAGIYPELQELFAGFQRTVTLSHVEKVLVLNAGQLPFFPQLEKLGVKANDRLPFDCMAWFAVTTSTGQ